MSVHICTDKCICLYLLCSHSVVSDSLRPHGLQHARFPCPSPSSEVRSNSCPICLHRGFQVALVIKNLPANAGDIRDVGSTPGLGRLPWRRARQPTPVFLLREPHGQRSLEGYSPKVIKSRIRLKRLWHAHTSLYRHMK